MDPYVGSLYHHLRGYSTSYPQLACFVFYLKIIDTFLKDNIGHASYSKLSKELKNSFKILIGQAVLELLIQTTFWLFDP